jgi:hypothetical protein
MPPDGTAVTAATAVTALCTYNFSDITMLHVPYAYNELAFMKFHI